MEKICAYAAIFTMLLLWSCGKTTQTEYVTFQTSKPLILKEVVNPNLLKTPGDLILDQDKVIIHDIHSEWFFHVYSFKDFSYLGRFIRKGRGPEEEIFVAPYYMLGNDTLLYQNFKSVKVGVIEMKEEGLVFSVVNEFKIPPEFHDDSGFFKLDSLLYSSISQRGVTKDFQVFCIKSGLTFESGEPIPRLEPEIRDSEWSGLFSAKLTSVRPDKRRLVSVFHHFPIVRIYDAKNTTIFRELYMCLDSVNDEAKAKKGFRHAEDYSASYYWRVRSTDDFIFALYSETITPEMEMKGNVPVYLDTATEIHIWDWDGQPIMELELDRPIFSFDVSSDNMQIVATSIVDTEKLFVADIPWDL